MRFIDCTCGCRDFDLTAKGNMVCKNCGKDFNPFEAEHVKVVKEDGFHFFWAIITPHFSERLERRVPGKTTDDIIEAAKEIEKISKKKKYYFTHWEGHKLFWIYKYNYKKKRLEMEFITVTPIGNKDKLVLPNGYVVKNTEFVKVNFDGKGKE